MSRSVFYKYVTCSECAGTGATTDWNAPVLIGRKETCRHCFGFGIRELRMTKEEVLKAVERMSP